MISKAVFFLVVLLLIMALQGCGGGGQESTTTEQTNTTEQINTTAQSGPTAEAIAEGKTLYQQSCLACHGEDGQGISGLGKALVGTEFMDGINDEALLAFINKGRAADDEDNTSGIAMPPKGGNSALTDEQINTIIAYLRSLTQ